MWPRPQVATPAFREQRRAEAWQGHLGSAGAGAGVPVVLTEAPRGQAMESNVPVRHPWGVMVYVNKAEERKHQKPAARALRTA